MILMAATPTTIMAFLGGSVGTGELLVLFLIILVMFGPRRLPEIARMLGRAMLEMRRAANEFRDHVMDIEVVEHTPRAAQPPPPAQIPGSTPRGALAPTAVVVENPPPNDTTPAADDRVQRPRSTPAPAGTAGSIEGGKAASSGQGG